MHHEFHTLTYGCSNLVKRLLQLSLLVYFTGCTDCQHSQMKYHVATYTTLPFLPQDKQHTAWQNVNCKKLFSLSCIDVSQHVT